MNYFSLDIEGAELQVRKFSFFSSKIHRVHIVHRVSRVLSFFSSRLNWDSPTSLAAGECAPHPFVRGGGGRAHSLAEEGLGSPNSDEGTYIVVFYIHM